MMVGVTTVDQTQQSLYCVANARSPQQAQRMRELEAGGVCVFCQLPDGDGFTTADGWTVRQNRWPYPWATQHLLVAPVQHLTDIDDPVPPGFDTAVAVAARRFGMDNFLLVARVGELESTGATVRHRHYHLIQGQGRLVAGSPFPDPPA